MAITRKGRVHIVSEDGYVYNARISDAATGEDLVIADATITMTPGEKITAYMKSYFVSLDMLADAEVEAVALDVRLLASALSDAAVSLELAAASATSLSDVLATLHDVVAEMRQATTHSLSHIEQEERRRKNAEAAKFAAEAEVADLAPFYLSNRPYRRKG